MSALVVALGLALSACTVSQGATYQADVQPWGSVYVHIYRLPSWQLLWVDRSPVCNRNTVCTMDVLQRTVDQSGGVPGIFGSFWNDAMTRRGEFAAALDTIEASGITAGVGTNRCLAMYSVFTNGWTTSDGAPCQPGQLVR